MKALLSEEKEPLGSGAEGRGRLLWTFYFCRSENYGSFRCASEWFWELGGSSQLWAVGRMNWSNTKAGGQQKKQTIEYNFFMNIYKNPQ